MPTQTQYIQKATQELLHPTLEATQQYLEVCELELKNGLPKVVRVNEEYHGDKVAVYFEVKDERYYIEVHVTKEPDIKVDSSWTQSAHRVYLTDTSKELSYRELASFLPTFEPLTGWSKDDTRGVGTSTYGFSRISFEPITNEAYELNEKLDLLLDDLEKDAEAVRELSQHADAIISVCRHQYIGGNAGIHFDIETIGRMKHLNLGIDIDTYIIGKELR